MCPTSSLEKHCSFSLEERKLELALSEANGMRVKPLTPFVTLMTGLILSFRMNPPRGEENHLCKYQ
jgi:hypothetical protein